MASANSTSRLETFMAMKRFFEMGLFVDAAMKAKLEAAASSEPDPKAGEALAAAQEALKSRLR